ncbi:hypothetical protein RND71_029078 [Anisodus tanguticus]|uniref:Uncharacterized protein n=1 Tax=Anisodus tanguticus TaxID=243964 RepID=A0AAE1V6V1_9SOLA|nr:hypothetical protein RND71_029078 [Anisodus tanguticus]
MFQVSPPCKSVLETSGLVEEAQNSETSAEDATWLYHIHNLRAHISRCHNALRSVGKAANRSAVHGTKLPIPDVVDKEQVEVEISQVREVKDKKRRELENAIDSQLKNWNVIRFSN